jgi:hypothetical protein
MAVLPSPFRPLFGALQIPKINHGNNDVGATIGISNDEEVDVAVAQSPRQVVVSDILRYVALKSICTFATSGGLTLVLRHSLSIIF